MHGYWDRIGRYREKGLDGREILLEIYQRHALQVVYLEMCFSFFFLSLKLSVGQSRRVGDE